MANSLLHLQWHSVLAVVYLALIATLYGLCGVGTSAAHVSGGASRPINLYWCHWLACFAHDCF